LKRIVLARHAPVCFRIVEQHPRLLDDSSFIGAHQLRGSSLHCLGTLGIVPQHQDRLAQRRRFFLNPSRIGQQQMGPPHQVDERNIAERID